MQPRYLFVYGTLRRGVLNPYAAMLAKSSRYMGPAKVQGSLHRVSHYCGLVASDHDEHWVRGDVYAIDHPAQTFRMLDQYEGRTAPHEFARTTRQAVLDSGEQVRAWVYVYTRPPAGRPRIISGDFLQQRRRRPAYVK